MGLSFTCAAGALIALTRTLSMALPGRPEPWPEHLLRRATAAVVWSLLTVYCLGFFGVLASELEAGDGAASLPAPACLEGFDAATEQGLTHHRSSYLPLRFDCVRADGTSYTADSDYVWINWTSASLALTAAALLLVMLVRSVAASRGGSGTPRATTRV
ncbi:hypothetical protein [Streptomyces composti]|uniref:hypothetical protein n=1 Tax=Streptomyces composti TaxID=2720025 RepID=UPI001F10D4DC|nr:hypothetical protein [Streptomyces composti]